MSKREVERLVQRGVTEARQEHKEEAEELLRQAVLSDPQNERAWLWLSAVVEGVENQRECLRRVLEINPSNSFARQGLSFLGHLRPGYEYLAARAPWMAGAEDDRLSLAAQPQRTCPRCGTTNPGWAYLCNRCAAPLEPLDVAKLARKEVRAGWGKRPSLTRPWGSAIRLDLEHVFVPEVALASPQRAILAIVLGALALNMLRAAGTLGLATIAADRMLSLRLLDRLTAAFLSEQLILLVLGLAAWPVLTLITRWIVHGEVGLGEFRVHAYLVAVAISAWMPVAAIVGLLWWVIIRLVPTIPVPLSAGIVVGLLYFYSISLLRQAMQTAHGLRSPGRTSGLIGVTLLGGLLVYAFLLVLAPPALQTILVRAIQVVMLPLWP